jgi:hypothetical protein
MVPFEAGDEVPDRATVRFRPSPGAADSARPEGEGICPVNDGIWRCEIPAGKNDIVIRAKGHVSHYFFDSISVPGSTIDLGKLTLRRGASLTGTVATEDRTANEEKQARVFLVPDPSGSSESESERRQRKARISVSSPNERGFFQFESLAPGRYIVEVRKAGFAPEWRSVVILKDVEATLLDTVVLSRARSLEVSVIPRQNPWGHPWHVDVSRLDRGYRTPKETRQESSVFKWDGLPSGRYRVTVRPPAERPEAHQTAWAFQDVELSGPTTTISIDAPAIPVEGTLSLGGKPVSGTLLFGRESMSISVPFDADDMGHFQGFLPTAGKWDVAVAVVDPSVERKLRGIDARMPSGKSTAVVDIDLPDAWLRGEVLDESGRPFPAAAVRIESKPIKADAEEWIEIAAGSDGSFSAHGLPFGRLVVRAIGSGGLQSNSLAVTVEPGVSIPDLKLVLKHLPVLEGTILSPHGPVPGATIWAFPMPWQWPAGWSPESATTGADGNFTLSIPRSIDDLDIVVLAPGHAFKALRHRVQQSRVPIVLESRGGRVVLSFRPSEGRQLYLLHGGAAVYGWVLNAWAVSPVRSSPSQVVLEIADMEPGRYAICSAPASEFTTIASGGVPPSGACDSGFLSTGGNLTLALPGK